MPSFGDFVRTQYFLKIPIPTASFASKTVIITGGNAGLGKEVVRHIVRLGATKAIIACRSQSRGMDAKRDIEASLKCDTGIIEVWELDIESPASIKRFVDRTNNTLPRLDVIINNAGMHSSKFVVVYGTERAIAVNVIGTFLLAVQLIPKLKETARNFATTPHMTFVGSALYDSAKWPDNYEKDIFSYYGDKAHFDFMNQYNISKLLQLYAVIKLSAVVDAQAETNPIVINTLDPCFCKTGLGSGDLPPTMKPVMRLFQAAAARTAEEGARLIVQTAAAGRETHGKYMRAGEVRALAPIAKDEEKAGYVWELLCGKLEGLQLGVLGCLE